VKYGELSVRYDEFRDCRAHMDSHNHVNDGGCNVNDCDYPCVLYSP
jgi:hypothetical protein